MTIIVIIIGDWHYEKEMYNAFAKVLSMYFITIREWDMYCVLFTIWDRELFPKT